MENKSQKGFGFILMALCILLLCFSFNFPENVFAETPTPTPWLSTETTIDLIQGIIISTSINQFPALVLQTCDTSELLLLGNQAGILSPGNYYEINNAVVSSTGPHDTPYGTVNRLLGSWQNEIKIDSCNIHMDPFFRFSVMGIGFGEGKPLSSQILQISEESNGSVWFQLRNDGTNTINLDEFLRSKNIHLIFLDSSKQILSDFDMTGSDIVLSDPNQFISAGNSSWVKLPFENISNEKIQPQGWIRVVLEDRFNQEQFKFDFLYEIQSSDSPVDGSNSLQGCGAIVYSEIKTGQKLTLDEEAMLQNEVIQCKENVDCLTKVYSAYAGNYSIGDKDDLIGQFYKKIEIVAPLVNRSVNCLSVYMFAEEEIKKISNINSNLLVTISSSKSSNIDQEGRSPSFVLDNGEPIDVLSLDDMTIVMSDQAVVEQLGIQSDQTMQMELAFIRAGQENDPPENYSVITQLNSGEFYELVTFMEQADHPWEKIKNRYLFPVMNIFLSLEPWQQFAAGVGVLGGLFFLIFSSLSSRKNKQSEDQILKDEAEIENPQDSSEAVFICLEGKNNLVYGNRINVKYSPFTIGSQRGCDYVINHPSVERKHTTLWFENEQWVLQDLNSRFGTYVNERRVYSHVLTQKVVVLIGDTEWELSIF